MFVNASFFSYFQPNLILALLIVVLTKSYKIRIQMSLKRKIQFYFTFILLFFLLLCGDVFAGQIKVATYNIRNFDYDQRSRTPTNKMELKKILKSINFDLLAVQEIGKTNQFKNYIAQHFPQNFQTFLSRCGGSNDQHLGFIVDLSKFKIIEFREDERTVNVSSKAGRRNENCFQRGSRPVAILKALHRTSDQKIAIISVHLKAGGSSRSVSKRFKQIARVLDLKEELKNNGYDKIIILGDFNTTEFLSRSGYMQQRFQDRLSKAQMKNQTKTVQCTSYWWGNRDDNYFYPSQLDHIVTSDNIRSSRRPKIYGHCKQLDCRASHEDGMQVSFNEVSDHCPLAIELEI
ncbi:MAG: hypothetical protein CME65_06270 [Halobacteriovoraceae bacterium]|nr:hypothetical protein [Halobacteriovoraceae bacterium]